MAKAKQRKKAVSEKFGELEGVRRPYWAAFILIVAVYFVVAMVDYSPLQDFYFRDGLLKEFVQNSSEPEKNVCGKFGATICLVLISIFGIGAYLILVFFFIIGVAFFAKKVRAITLFSAFSILMSVVLFSTLGALFHMLKDEAMASTPYFTAGLGGKLGSLIYVQVFHPAFRFFGSLILLSIAYGFFFISAISDSPKIVIRELCTILAYVPKLIFKCLCGFFMWLASLIQKGIEGAPKKLQTAQNEESSDTQTDTNATLGDSENNEEDSANEDSSSENLEGESENFGDKKVSDVLQDPISEVKGVATLEEVLGKLGGAENASEENTSEEILDSESAQCADDVGVRSLEDVGKMDGEDVGVGELAHSSASAEDSFGTSVTGGLKIRTVETQEYTPPEQKPKYSDYIYPTLDILATPPSDYNVVSEDFPQRMRGIVNTLANFKVAVRPAEVFSGPVVSRYEIFPEVGVKVSKVFSYDLDIALALNVKSVRLSTTDRGTIGFEVPNKIRKIVYFRDILESQQWNETKGTLPVAIGKNITGIPVVLDIAKMPHALVSGTTGSGKSKFLDVLIVSLLYKFTPKELRLVLIDPKMVGFYVYNEVPHMLVPVVTDGKKAAAALSWLVEEMERRLKVFVDLGATDIGSFNEIVESYAADGTVLPQVPAGAEIPSEKMPYIVCFIDELADLMAVARKDVEILIQRLAQKSRAAGIHLIVAAQRPSTDVVTGVIKANLPMRIALKAASGVDSKVVLDAVGAETLIGHGDLLFIPPGTSDLVRAQCALINDEERAAVVKICAQNGAPEFEESMQSSLDSAGEDDIDDDVDWSDEMAPKAWRVIKENNRASVSFLQRKLRLGYNRAASIMDELEEKGYVGPDKGQGSRDILM